MKPLVKATFLEWRTKKLNKFLYLMELKFNDWSLLSGEQKTVKTTIYPGSETLLHAYC